MTTTIGADFGATDPASLELRQLVEQALLRHERIRCSGGGLGIRRGIRDRPSCDLAFYDVRDPDAVARLVADTDAG